MYFAKIEEGGKQKYIIRKSYFDSELGCYNHRLVFDLGKDPGRFVERYDDNSFWFNESLEDAAAGECEIDPSPVLEDLLWTFLSAEDRQKILQFRRPGNMKITSLSEMEKEEIERYVHLFDRRRLYYIRYGAVDQGRIFRLDDRIYRPLLYKCRDEKEYYFREQEMVLEPSELRTYIYAIFNLQQGFSEKFASFMPEALAQEEVEDLFEKELCRLNADKTFWQEEQPHYFLHKHLQRYAIQFFDSEYQKRSFESDFFRSFRNSHRKFHWPAGKAAITEEETSEIFGEKLEVLKKMKEKELARLFRKKAKELHPDSGGDHENFIRLLSAYDELRRSLKG
jgi:hypothetical protein